MLGLQVMTLMTSLPLVLDRADLAPTSTVVTVVVDLVTAAAAGGSTGLLDLTDVTPLQEAVDAVALSALYAQPKRRDVAAAMATMNQVRTFPGFGLGLGLGSSTNFLTHARARSTQGDRGGGDGGSLVRRRAAGNSLSCGAGGAARAEGERGAAPRRRAVR